MEYGAAAGLAYVHPFYQDLQASRQQAELAINLDANARAKTKALADMFRFGKANNPYDHRKLNDHINTTVEEIGKYTIENPDWDKNPDKYAFVVAKTRSLEDNEYVINALKFDEQVRFMQESVSKNPTIAQRDSFQKTLEEMNNYIEHGSIDGVEQNRKPFMYTPIDGFADLNQVAQKVGSNFGGIIKKTDPKGYPGNWYDDVDEQELGVAAYQMYSQYKEEFDKTYTSSGYSDPMTYAKELIKTYVKRSAHQGYPQYDPSFIKSKSAHSSRGKDSSEATNTWNNNVAAYKTGYESPAVWKSMFTDNVPVQLLGRSGKWNNVLGSRPVNFTGKHAMLKDADSREMRFLEVETKLPFKVAVDMGIANENFYFDEDKSNINEEYYDIAKYESDTKGEIKVGPKGFVTLKGWMPINEKSGAMSKLYEDALKISAPQQSSMSYLDSTTGGRMFPIKTGNGYLYTPDGYTFYSDNNLSSDIVPVQSDSGKYYRYNFETNSFEEYE